LIHKLKEKGSWCGETHVQKATYLLKELFDIPLDFDFILYKHGPFSFDLRDELTALRADDVIRLESNKPYGPSIIPKSNSQQIIDKSPKTLDQYGRNIEYIASKVNKNNVSYLERVATALYVTNNYHDTETPEDRGEIMHDLKPHVSLEDAIEAVNIIDEIIKDVEGSG
jgi:hypothetical protein